MEFFTYKGNIYTKIIPSKRLFNSTMVHDVVTRGDMFALNVNTGLFTVLPKDSDQKENSNGDNKV